MAFACESLNHNVYESIASATSPQPLRDKQKAADAAETAAKDIIDTQAPKQAATFTCDAPCENPPWYKPHVTVLVKTAIEVNYEHNNVAQPPVYVGLCILYWTLDILCSKPYVPTHPKEKKFYVSALEQPSESQITAEGGSALLG